MSTTIQELNVEYQPTLQVLNKIIESSWEVNLLTKLTDSENDKVPVLRRKLMFFYRTNIQATYYDSTAGGCISYWRVQPQR